MKSKDVHPHKDLYEKAYTKFIHSLWNLEVSKFLWNSEVSKFPPISEWPNTLWYIHEIGLNDNMNTAQAKKHRFQKLHIVIRFIWHSEEGKLQLQ